MNIVKLEPQYYNNWNKFCYDNHWFWHTTHWLFYLVNSKFDVDFKHHSFFLVQDNQIKSIVPLIQEDDQLFSPGFDFKPEILERVNQIAIENNIKRISVDDAILGYINDSKFTCILDLDNIKPSKGHKSAIKKGEKYLTCEPFFNIKQFQKDYFEIAGKDTRPLLTFLLLSKWIKQGYGTLLRAKYNEETAGYSYVLHYKDSAYYFMSGVFKQFKEFNVSHFLQNETFKLLKQKGIKYYELGEQCFNSLDYLPSEKEKNISLFKRNFGGNIVVKPISEYFFSKEYFEQIMYERIKKYMEAEYK